MSSVGCYKDIKYFCVRNLTVTNCPKTNNSGGIGCLVIKCRRRCLFWPFRKGTDQFGGEATIG